MIGHFELANQLDGAIERGLGLGSLARLIHGRDGQVSFPAMGEARPGMTSRDWWRIVLLMYVLCVLVVGYFVVIAAQQLLVGSGHVGSPGTVTVTECHGGGKYTSCTGTFTPANPLAPPRSGVHVLGAVKTGGPQTARLFNGEAWPASYTRQWPPVLLFGLFFLVVGGALTLANLVRRRRSPEGDRPPAVPVSEAPPAPEPVGTEPAPAAQPKPGEPGFEYPSPPS